MPGPTGLTAHVLRMPSAKDVIEYRRGFASVLDLLFNKQELTINLARAGGCTRSLLIRPRAMPVRTPSCTRRSP